MSKELNVLEEGKEALVPPFNKKDIEEIAKAACPRGIDLDRLDSYDFVEYDGAVDDIDEAIEKGVIPANGMYENLTDEQVNGLEKILKKVAKEGLIQIGFYYMFINYINFYSKFNFNLCFGCQSYHASSGAHLEVNLSLELKALEVIITEV